MALHVKTGKAPAARPHIEFHCCSFYCLRNGIMLLRHSMMAARRPKSTFVLRRGCASLPITISRCQPCSAGLLVGMQAH